MPDDILKPHHDKEENGTDTRSTHHFQSAWMAHWMHASFKSTAHPSSHSSIDFNSKGENKEHSGSEEHDLLGEPGTGKDNSTDPEPEAFKEATKATPVAFLNESLTTEKSKGRSLDFKSFPIFSLSPRREGMLSLKREQHAIYHEEVLKSQTDGSSKGLSPKRHWGLLPSTSTHMPPTSATLSSDCHLLPEGILPTELLRKSQYAVEKKNLWNDFVKSTSDAVPCGHNKENTSVPSCTCGQRKAHKSSYNLASMRHFTSTDYSYSLFVQEKMSSLVDPQRYGFLKLMQSGPAPLPRGPVSTSDDLVGDQSQKTQNYSGTARFSNQCSPFESTKRENCYHGISSASQLPCSVHDMETMKIYKTVDSVEGSSGDHPNISQATCNFLISQKADVNLSDRGQHFRKSITPTKFKGNALHEIPNFSPSINYHAPKGVKLKALGSSMESEGKENIQDLETPTSLRNESSAETDTMDINAFQENYLSGDVSMPSKKCPKDSQNSPTPPVPIRSSGREKNKEKSVNTSLPDINQELAELPAVASPEDEREASTSRTQSLDVERFLSNAEENAYSKSSSCGNGSFGPEPSSRWVKRLKLSTPDSAYGMKSAKIVETASHEKVNRIFSQIMKGSKTNPKSKMICHAEQQMIENSPETTSANSKSSLLKAKRTAEITLSHPWIQRWRNTNALSTQKKHGPMELHEPPSSNNTHENLEKKQFPSIAAMALMGKAMGTFYPCEIMKKGPLMVWNSKRL